MSTQETNSFINKDPANRTLCGVGGGIDASGYKQGKVTASFIANDKLVYRFMAYFKESVPESSIESFRVRKCDILYYKEDNTISIKEKSEQNSGIPQGQFVKRGKIPKNSDENLTDADLFVGANVKIYGRVFHICDADAYTRSAKPGMDPTEEYPADKHKENRRFQTEMQDPNVKKGKRTNPLTRYMEASLGNAAPRQRGSGADGLSTFLKNDGKVLHYDCLWEDNSLYGMKNHYRINYFLSDDTMEVLETYTVNSGKDPFPLMLKRSRVPKGTYLSPEMNGVEDVTSEEELRRRFIVEQDLKVGQTINVMGKKMLIYGCDKATLDWWKENEGIDMSLDFIDVSEAPKQKIEVAVPPKMGFMIGSEEDSLASSSLIPKAPRKNVKKILSNAGVTLRFQAKVSDSKKPVDSFDAGRSFTIKYFVGDDTVSIHETPVRNSGIMGGPLLARGKYVTGTSGTPFEAQDFAALGNVVDFPGVTLEITAIDEYTKNKLEEGV